MTKTETNSSVKEAAQGTTSTEPVIHNLLSRDIRPICNWDEFLERWQAAITLDEMLGLLHAGFNDPISFDGGYSGWDKKKYDPTDRVIFYLERADGWADHRLLVLPTDGEGKYRFGRDENGNTIEKTPSELRQELARKAFDMLCLNFFKPASGHSPNQEEFMSWWQKSIVTDRLLPVITNLFRVQKQYYSKDNVEVRNLSGQKEDRQSNNEKQVIVFFINLAKFLWGWKEKRIDSWTVPDIQTKIQNQNAVMRIRVNSAMPWMIEVLAQLGRLDVLERWMLDLDETCLVKLKEIALRNKIDKYIHPVSADRQVLTLDEACYLGSPTGWFLIRRELKEREHGRLTDILDAERKKEEDDRRLKELTTASK